MLLPFSRQLFILITPFNLLFAAYMLFRKARPGTEFIFLGIFIMVTSFLAEAIGVATGRIFGSYSYGRALGPEVWDTPVLIGLNWLVLIYCTNTVARQIWERPGSTGTDVRGSIAVPVTGSLLMVFYDLLLEPAAMKLDMWSWDDGIIPLRNYAAWFVLSLLYHLLFLMVRKGEVNKTALPLYLIQVLFFALINIFFYLVV
jgi:putative membrane protein